MGIERVASPGSGDVCVWIARVSEHAPRTAALAALLDRREVETAGRFRFAGDRIRYIVAHGLLRLVLGAAARCAPERLAFTFGPYGKPSLSDPGGAEPLEFNLSHAGDRVVVATARRPVGVDVECCAATPPGGEIASIDAWTRTEAYAKALGTGIAAAPAAFDVSAWSLVTLDVGRDYVGAVVAAGDDWRVHAGNLTPELVLPGA